MQIFLCSSKCTAIKPENIKVMAVKSVKINKIRKNSILKVVEKLQKLVNVDFFTDFMVFYRKT
jgi:hypothetical protein